jgi:hypothetical protein
MKSLDSLCLKLMNDQNATKKTPNESSWKALANVYKSKLKNDPSFPQKYQSFFVRRVLIKKRIRASMHYIPFNTHTNSVQYCYKDFEIWNLVLMKNMFCILFQAFSGKDNHVFEKSIINSSLSLKDPFEWAIDRLSSPLKEFLDLPKNRNCTAFSVWS